MSGAIRHPFFGTLQNASDTHLCGRADTQQSFSPEIESSNQRFLSWADGRPAPPQSGNAERFVLRCQNQKANVAEPITAT